MLSRLQELKKEEETLLKVEELALQSMISTEREDSDASSPAQPDLAEIAMQVDDESKINQTALQLNAFAVEQGLEEEQQEEEEEEEEEEEDN